MLDPEKAKQIVAYKKKHRRELRQQFTENHDLADTWQVEKGRLKTVIDWILSANVQQLLDFTNTYAYAQRSHVSREREVQIGYIQRLLELLDSDDGQRQVSTKRRK